MKLDATVSRFVWPAPIRLDFVACVFVQGLNEADGLAFSFDKQGAVVRKFEDVFGFSVFDEGEVEVFVGCVLEEISPIFFAESGAGGSESEQGEGKDLHLIGKGPIGRIAYMKLICSDVQDGNETVEALLA